MQEPWRNKESKPVLQGQSIRMKLGDVRDKRDKPKDFFIEFEDRFHNIHKWEMTTEECRVFRGHHVTFTEMLKYKPQKLGWHFDVEKVLVTAEDVPGFAGDFGAAIITFDPTCQQQVQTLKSKLRVDPAKPKDERRFYYYRGVWKAPVSEVKQAILKLRKGAELSSKVATTDDKTKLKQSASKINMDELSASVFAMGTKYEVEAAASGALKKKMGSSV
jgi:hypothetical protein